MRLRKLEVKGFKTFKDKVSLEFPDKFTVIVGPNGSGKSNLTEAICFVLGKSRGLRATNLQELIFNGGKNFAPADKTIVSVEFVEDDGTVHRLSRMVDRDGHSQYKLDDKRVTRQHIIDLVGDNEYNIILQDDVTRVIEMKPQERRTIIDDLCGIAEYDQKKDKALKELKKVEEHINESHIRLGEKQNYLRELGKERDEALRFKKAREDLRQIEASILHYEINRLTTSEVGLKEKQTTIDTQRDEDVKKLAETKNALEKIRQRTREISSRLIQLEEEKGVTKAVEMRGQIARIQDRIHDTADRKKKADATIQDGKRRTHALQKEEETLSAKAHELHTRLVELTKSIDEETKKLGDEKLEAQINELRQHISDLKAERKSLVESTERLTEERAATSQKELADKASEAKSTLDEIRERITEAEGKHEVTTRRIDKLKERKKGLDEKIIRLRSEAEKLRIDEAQKQAEWKALSDAGGGVNKAVSSVLKLKDVIRGIHGTVSQLGKVVDEDYEIALEIAAQGRLQDIVVDNIDVAAKCIRYLREKQIGRATFIPLDKVRVKTAKEFPSRAFGFARDFIDCDDAYDGVFNYVFGDTLVVSDLETAKQIGIGSYRMVTLEGDLIERTGVVTGGHIIKSQGIGFTNIDALEEEVKKIRRTLEEQISKVSEAEEEASVVDNEIREVSVIASESLKASHDLAVEQKGLEEREGDFRRRAEEAEARLTAVEETLEKNRQRIKDIDRQVQKEDETFQKLWAERGGSSESPVNRLKDESRDVEIEKGRVEEKITLNKQQIKEIHELVKVAEEEIKVHEKAIAELDVQKGEIESALKKVEEETKVLSKEIGKLLAEREVLDGELTELGSQQGAVERRLLEVGDEVSKLRVRLAEVTAQLNELRKQYAGYEGVAVVDLRIGELTQKKQQLEEMLATFGAVNLKSIETYDVIKNEYEEVRGKLDTLKSERQSIFDFMAEVEKRKLEAFTGAFDVVRANFEDIYSKLSGGSGTLILDNPKSISESGLIIKASPPGKKVMNLEAMSGGEKTLTSSAFLLAIQQYKPTHFYVVDELDAALDRSNSLKLAEMLKGSDSQFILVTHNDAMIQYAQSVIGVSMKDGFSQIVGVRLE
ncbi:Chromosome partition protein Smc [uncultured archaeon]|nr:Chromosome partition protein Smc [uncultured archaeon]